MHTGKLPQIDVHPKITGTVEPGEFLKLECKATGKGPLHYVWQHDNQTLVMGTGPELIIKHVNESDQGVYRCHVTNAYGYAVSESAILKLSECSILRTICQHNKNKCYSNSRLSIIDFKDKVKGCINLNGDTGIHVPTSTMLH